MRRIRLIKYFTATMLALSLILSSTGSWGVEQVLEEVGVAGQNGIGEYGVVRPDFDFDGTADPREPSHTDWVEPALNDIVNEATIERDFRAFAISARGTALVLNGTSIQEFTSSGAPKTDAGFPVDCTDLPFNVPKKNGSGVQSKKLSECTAFTPLNDGTIRIAGKINGGGFVIIEYDPDPSIVPRVATLKANGTPPTITDMDADESDADPAKHGYYAIGDKKKVLFFPFVNEQNFDVIATLNGVRLDAVTRFLKTPTDADRVIVALDSGELRWVDTITGVATPFAFQLTGGDCGLSRKDPQKFSARATPNGRLFVGNLGCHSVTIYNEQLQQISTNTELVNNPFLLTMAEDLADGAFSPVALDWQEGVSGDFGDCDGDTPALGCQAGAKENQLVIFDVQSVTGTDTTFRMFQFNDLVDCRWATDEADELIRPCPIIDCTAASTGGDETGCPVKELQTLDLAQLLVAADVTGEFVRAAFGDPPIVPVMAIPGYIRAEESYPCDSGPTCDAGSQDNDYKFYTFFAVTDAVLTGIHQVDYVLNEFRSVGSVDPCNIPGPFSSVIDINETFNVIVYNTDTFDTINRGGAQGSRGGTIINSFCNGGGAAFNWSSQSVGFEVYDESPTAYLDLSILQLQELEKAHEELLCDATPAAGVPGPLLDPDGDDCANIDNEIDQMIQKQGVCFASLFYPQNGSSAENCNALFTKIANLETLLDNAAWPPVDDESPTPPELVLLAPNYEGEFKARLASYVFVLESYVLNSVPAAGIGSGPILSAIGDQNATVGVNLDILVSATDPNGDSMTMKVSDLLGFCDVTDDLNPDGTGGRITCNPDPELAGTIHSMTVTVTDDGEPNLTDSETFDINVAAP